MIIMIVIIITTTTTIITRIITIIMNDWWMFEGIVWTKFSDLGYGGFLSHGGTPSYHQFYRIFHEINHPFWISTIYGNPHNPPYSLIDVWADCLKWIILIVDVSVISDVCLMDVWGDVAWGCDEWSDMKCWWLGWRI